MHYDVIVLMHVLGHDEWRMIEIKIIKQVRIFV